jgi:hypothetical protein
MGAELAERILEIDELVAVLALEYLHTDRLSENRPRAVQGVTPHSPAEFVFRKPAYANAVGI